MTDKPHPFQDAKHFTMREFMSLDSLIDDVNREAELLAEMQANNSVEPKMFAASIKRLKEAAQKLDERHFDLVCDKAFELAGLDRNAPPPWLQKGSADASDQDEKRKP